MNKDYLGDSVYVASDHNRIILSTENGLPNDPSNIIVLEQETLRAFVTWAVRHGWLNASVTTKGL